MCVCVCCGALCCMVWKIQMWSGSIHLRSLHKKPREHSACHVKCFLLAQAGLALCRGFRFWSDRLRILCLWRLGEPKSPGLWGEAMCWDQDIEVFRESLELVCGACGYSWGESAEREREQQLGWLGAPSLPGRLCVIRGGWNGFFYSAACILVWKSTKPGVDSIPRTNNELALID